MNRRIILSGAAAAFLNAPSAFAEASPSGTPAEPITAAMALAHERDLAARANTSLMVVFFASWCAWCRYLDALLADEVAGGILRDHFRIYHLRVLEHATQFQQRQLLGANAIFNAVAPEGSGVPFIAFQDAQGRVLATSYSERDGGNIGFPTRNGELRAFDAMLARAAPSLNAADRNTVIDACVRLAPR